MFRWKPFGLESLGSPAFVLLCNHERVGFRHGPLYLNYAQLDLCGCDV